MISLLWKREDGSFVAQVNGHPYHVVEGDEPLWSQAVENAAEMGAALAFEPPPVAVAPILVTRLAKAEIWRRLTDAEADTLDGALAAAPTRLRRIFDAAQYIDAADADYPALRYGIVAALGEARAAEILAPLA